MLIMKDILKRQTKYFHCLIFAALFLVFHVFASLNVLAAGNVAFPGKVTVMSGDTASLELKGNTKNVTYSTSNSEIVKIIKKTKTRAVIQAGKTGTASVTAKTGNKTYTCKVTVSPISPETAVTAGETELIELAAGSGQVKWNSSNTSIVKIQKTGKKGAVIKGVSSGKATVTAKIGKKRYTCSVTVRKPVSMKKEMTVITGKTATLKLENNTDKVVWSVSNKSVVKIQSKSNKSAVLKGVAPGTAKVTAKIGKKKLVCSVTVKAKVSLTSKTTVTMGKTKEIVLNNNTDKVIWSSSDNKIVKLSKKTAGGAVVKGIAPGTAIVTAKIGSKKYTCSVTVVEPEYTYKITPLLAPFNEYFYVQTEDPDVSDLAFADKKSSYYSAGDETDHLVLCKHLFLDVKYENKKTYRVKGGYIFESEHRKLDGGTLYIQTSQEDPYSWTVKYTDTKRKVTCPKVKTAEQYLIDKYTKSGMTFFQKLDAVQAALDDLALYPRSTLDVTKKNSNTPYPLLAVSPYPELSLNDWYLMYEYSEDGLLLNFLYPYVLDSLGVPGEMAAVAKLLNSSCEVAWGDYHYLVDVTLNGETHSYGGAGKGGSDPLHSNRVKQLFLFDGSKNDYSANTSLQKLSEKRMEYGELAASDAEYYKDLITGDTFTKTIGMGSWIRVGTEGFNISSPSYAYVTQGAPYTGSPEDYTFSVEDIWVDGRYINTNNRYEKGATFSEHPKASILIRNMTYKDKWGNTRRGDVEYNYNEETGTWISDAFRKEHATWWTVDPDDEIPDDMILTQEEVKALNVDRNTNKIPSSGYIYDGSVMPGTAF